MKTETGIEIDFAALTETQAPYLTGGTVTLAVGQYQGSYYEGGYADAVGKEYRAIWTEIDTAADDDDAADWAHPDYLIDA